MLSALRDVVVVYTGGACVVCFCAGLLRPCAHGQAEGGAEAGAASTTKTDADMWLVFDNFLALEENNLVASLLSAAGAGAAAAAAAAAAAEGEGEEEGEGEATNPPANDGSDTDATLALPTTPAAAAAAAAAAASSSFALRAAALARDMLQPESSLTPSAVAPYRHLLWLVGKHEHEHAQEHSHAGGEPGSRRP